MDDNNDAMATDEVRRRFKLLLWAILVLATTFWIPFGYLGLTSISLRTPFSALLVLVGIPGSLVLVNMALSRRSADGRGSDVGGIDFDLTGSDSGGECGDGGDD